MCYITTRSRNFCRCTGDWHKMIQSDLLWVTSVCGVFGRGERLFSLSAVQYSVSICVCVNQEYCLCSCTDVYTAKPECS